MEGARRVSQAPAILISVYLLTLLTALPLTTLVHDALRTHRGNSIAAERAASGVDLQWWTECFAQAGALGKTF